MTHEEFKKQWGKKHRSVFSDINKVLKAHGISGKVDGLTMVAPKSVIKTMSEAVSDCCGDGCKKPPCGANEREEICTCPDGSGGFKVHKCCVPKG